MDKMMYRRSGPFSSMIPYRSEVEAPGGTLLKKSEKNIDYMSSGIPIARNNFDDSIDRCLSFVTAMSKSHKNLTLVQRHRENTMKARFKVGSDTKFKFGNKLEFGIKFLPSKVVDLHSLLMERLLFNSFFDTLMSTIAYVPSTKEFWTLNTLMLS